MVLEWLTDVSRPVDRTCSFWRRA